MESPPNQNQALEELSVMFFEDSDDLTPGFEFIEEAYIDFTVDSLRDLDKILDQVRESDLSDEEVQVFVLRAGAYVGEVIRRHTTEPKSWTWLAYNDAVSISPTLASYGIQIGTAAVLWGGGESFIFPLAKVSKYLENGPEDSLHFYAQVTIANPSIAAS